MAQAFPAPDRVEPILGGKAVYFHKPCPRHKDYKKDACIACTWEREQAAQAEKRRQARRAKRQRKLIMTFE